MTQGFAEYDTRYDFTVDVVTGYTAWSHTYDRTVHDELELPLLASLQTVLWPQLRTDVYIAHRPARARHRHQPIGFVMIWQAQSPPTG